MLAPRAPRARAHRVRHRARGRAPRRNEPFPPFLGAARAAVSRVPVGQRKAGTRSSDPSPIERPSMRLLHTMLRVGDLQRSVKFYTDVLGMKLLRTTDRPEQKYSLAFVGYDDESRQSALELTYNYGVER